MSKILVLCTGNSCRSQMAEGWLNYFTSDNIKVYSAGTKPEHVNSYAIKAMAELGIDISKNTSNHAEEYAHLDFDYVFTVCNNAKEICPIYPNAKMLLHQCFPDPASAKGSEEEIIQQYRMVRELLKTYFQDFVNSIK